jgi:hypothetical protein
VQLQNYRVDSRATQKECEDKSRRPSSNDPYLGTHRFLDLLFF